MGEAPSEQQLEPFIPKDGPEIRTKRLVLRPLRESDDWAVFAMRSRMEVMKWSLKRLPDDDISQTRNHLRRWNGPQDLSLVILEAEGGSTNSTTKDSETGGPVCGILGFNLSKSRVELGYMLHPDVWGKGYATEAVAAAIEAYWADYAGIRTSAAGVGDTTLWAETYPGNEPSYRVLIKCGFKKEADLVDDNGEYEMWRLDRAIPAT